MTDPDTLRGMVDRCPDTEPRPFADLRSSGLLWLINRVAFHPRGLALALHYTDTDTDTGEPHGWSLLTNDEGEPWQFDPTTDYHGYQRAEATLTAALAAHHQPATEPADPTEESR